MADVQEIFGATTVGLFAVFIPITLVIFASELLKRDARCLEKLRKLVAEHEAPAFVYVSILFPVVFAFGLMVQDTMDRLTDTGYQSSLFGVIAKPLGSEGSHRLRILFADDKLTRMSPLWCNMGSQRHYLRRILNSTYRDVGDTESFLNDIAKFVAKKDGKRKAERYVNTLFYEAKNWSYSQPTYFRELESIQRRIDFSRSVFLVAAVGACLSVLLFIASVIAWYRRGADTSYTRRTKRVMLRAVITVFVLFLLSGVATFGYGNAQVYFNERAFGYYVSHLQYRTLVGPESRSGAIDTTVGSRGPCNVDDTIGNADSES